MKKSIATILAVVCGVAVALAAQVKLVWDANDPAEEVSGYVVYERIGTNWVAVATVATNEAVLTVQPGLHVFTVKASNWWGTSPFSDTVQTPPAASAPSGQRIVRVGVEDGGRRTVTSDQ